MQGGARARKLPGSLGGSWGDAEYESEDSMLIDSASDVGSDLANESDLEDNDLDDKENTDDNATPMPQRARRTPQERSAPERGVASQNLQPSLSSRATPRSILTTTPETTLLEPALIMPSMAQPEHNGSPLRSSQVRARRQQPLSTQVNSARSRAAAGAPRVPRRPARQQPGRRAVPEQGPWHYPHLFWLHVLWPALHYVLTLGVMTLEYLKPFIAIGIAAWLGYFFLNRASGSVSSAVQTTLSQVCIIPGSSYVLPFCAYSPKSPHNGTADEPDFDTFMHIQSSFEDIVKQNLASNALPHTMKQSELAVRDVRSLVKYSKLPSKSELYVELSNFLETSKEATEQLTRYNFKIGSTVDRVINTNKWTMHFLNDLAEKEATKGIVERAISNLNPLTAFSAPPPTLQERVFEQFIKHVTTNKGYIDGLVQYGLSLLATLRSVEERLEVIHELATHDETHVSEIRAELFSQLWSKLGGNSASRHSADRQLEILRNVMLHHSQALAIVSGTLLKLHEIDEALGNLRDSVAGPEVLGSVDQLPLGHYFDLVEQATNRLQHVRGEAKIVEKSTLKGAMGEDVHVENGLPERRSDEPVVFARVKAGKKATATGV